jgi:predicted membrane channel-forming protein YqfA (hemolysin III family)
MNNQNNMISVILFVAILGIFLVLLKVSALNVLVVSVFIMAFSCLFVGKASYEPVKHLYASNRFK